MKHELEQLKKYVRATNYLVASQLYLHKNFLLKEKLSFDDIKPRLLGHWGTSPGINFVYAQLNHLIKKNDITDMMFVLGPGHGFPALQANLFLEGTLEQYYPEATRDLSGISYISKSFSWPYLFPSHSNPGTPGVILEGGELGYSLSTSYGAILDNPDLIVACMIGDGEAETGPTATAWHLNKFIDPKSNGAVLPILHLNGYKISGPTIFGRMSDKEIKALFTGYGYEPFIVSSKTDKIYEQMAKTLDVVYKKIQNIQKEAKKNNSSQTTPPRWPMIILKTPKGWTGIKTLHGEKLEGNNLSHQIIAKNAKTDSEDLEAVEKWMHSYYFEEIFSEDKGFSDDILDILPPEKLRMGRNKHTFGGNIKDLTLPKTERFAEEANIPGTIGSSSMRRAGLYLREVFAENRDNKNFRMFSPDETYSNKLDAVFEETHRAFVWPQTPWDKDISLDGRVIEMLSEHSLQGLIQGYVLTGRHAVFASYEAFIEIVSSMTNQYAKFLRIARKTPWRGDVPSLNYILTSSGWRQEHNGFSHQNPGFVSNMLEKHGCFIRVYFPADGNMTLEVLKTCLERNNEIHLIVAGKTLEPRWLTTKSAREELEAGLAIWDFASDKNPDIVFVGIGDYLTKEALAAISILKSIIPKVRIRFVNIVELTALGIGNEECQTQKYDFDYYFTSDKPAIFNFYGYPEAIQPMLITKSNPERFRVHGYIENGSTTTPFDMQVRNETSRFHLVMEAVQMLSDNNVIEKEIATKITKEMKEKLSNHRVYIKKHGVDPDEIENWVWKQKN
jgi:xylulose-5-phosphate/fructose-6-phosphate phosphoketolase